MSATSSSPPAAYHVKVLPARHEIEVTLRLESPPGTGTLILEVPTWVPGDYEFMPFGRDLFDVRATDERTGDRLPVRRDSWPNYRVETPGGAVCVAYTAYCSAAGFGEPCGILDDRYGVLLGTRYLRARAHPGPCRVTYELPEGWGLHHPSGARPIGPWTWEYPSYEVLLDTPVSLGAFDRISRSVRGTDFHHVFLTRGVGFATQVDRLVDRLTQVAEAYHDLFGSFPFEDYTYVFSLDPTADWGLEHLSSTMIGLGPDVFTDPDQNAIGVRTCAHELFHAWNVRRLRPAPLGDLDLERGSFTEGLWVAEGFTRYYEFLTCTRTGVYSPSQFFSAVVNYYRHLAVLPAYRRITAVDSSLATYLNHQKYPGRVNDSIDYYDKGMVIAFILDATLRSTVSGGSLDAAFRDFYREFVGRGAGYSTADVLEFFRRLGPGLGEFLSGAVEQAAGLSLVDSMAGLGFLVEDETVPYIGLVLRDDAGPGIYGVLDDSPAGGGIAPEDVIVAVNGYPFSAKALRWVIANEREVMLGVMRGNQSRNYAISVAHRTQVGELSWAGDDQQAGRIAAWLSRDFQMARGELVPLDFYENFHGIETVI